MSRGSGLSAHHSSSPPPGVGPHFARRRGNGKKAASRKVHDTLVNIGAARVTTTQDQKSLQTFDLWVTDVGTLNAVMKQIGKIKGVLSVDRMRP